MRIGRQTFLNSREAGEVLEMIAEQWKIDDDFIKRFKSRHFFIRNAEEKIFVLSRKAEEINLASLRINSAGLYIAEIHKGRIRLSIEGSQIFGPEAGQNVVELSREEVRKWIAGEDIAHNGRHKGNDFVIIRHSNDFFGSGRINEEKIFNFYPKTRRIAVD